MSFTSVKKCSSCGTVKPLDEFYKQASSKDGHHNQCKYCKKESAKRTYQRHKQRLANDQRQRLSSFDGSLVRAKRLYGATYETWSEHWYCTSCSICGADLPVGVGDRSKHYDHEHGTTEYRGTLCRLCNLMLGHAGDDPDVLRKAAAYLERQNDYYTK